MDSTKLAALCRELADNRKAEDLIVLDLREVSSIADYFVMCTGTSEPHLRAIVDEITETLSDDHGLKPRATEGLHNSPWVVLDYFDVLVHVMRKDVREHYNLEALWGDAPKVLTGKEKPAKTPRARKTAAAATSSDTEAPAKVSKKAPASKKPGARTKKAAATKAD